MIISFILGLCQIGRAKTLTTFDGHQLMLQRGKIYTILKVQDVDIVLETAESNKKIRSINVRVGTTNLLITIDPQTSRVCSIFSSSSI